MGFTRREFLATTGSISLGFPDSLRAQTEIYNKEPFLDPKVLIDKFIAIYDKHVPPNTQYPLRQFPYEELTIDAKKYLEDILDSSNGELGKKWTGPIKILSGEWIVYTDTGQESATSEIGISYVKTEYPFTVRPDEDLNTRWDRGRGFFRVSAYPEDPVTIPTSGFAVRLSPNYVLSPFVNHAELAAKLKSYRDNKLDFEATKWLSDLARKNPTMSIGNRNNPLWQGQWLAINSPGLNSRQTTSTKINGLGTTELLFYSFAYGLSFYTTRLTILEDNKFKLNPNSELVNAIYLGGPSKTQFIPFAPRK